MSARSRSALLGAAAAFVLLVGCGDQTAQTSAPAAVEPAQTAAAPAAAPAAAQGVLVDAETLRARLTDFVKAIESSSDAETTVKADGTVTVASTADAVTGTIPAFRFSDAAGKETAVLPASTIVFTRGATADEFPFTVTLGGPLAFDGEDGKGTLSWKTDAFTGVWRDSLQTFSVLDIRLSDVVAQLSDGTTPMKFAAVVLQGQTSPVANDRHDMTFTGALRGLDGSDATEGTTFKLGEISFTVSSKASDLLGYAKAAREVNWTVGNAQMWQMYAGTPELPEAAAALLRRTPEFFTHIDYGFALKDLTVTEQDAPPFTLGSAGFGLAIDGRAGQKGTLGVRVDAGGMSIPAAEIGVAPEMLPSGFKVDFDIAGIPSDALWAAYVDLIVEAQKASAAAPAPADPAAAPEDDGMLSPEDQAMEDATNRAMERIFTAMETAPLAIAIKALDLTAPAASMKGTGQLAYEAAKAPMPTGTISLRFAGLEEIKQILTQRSNAGDEGAGESLLGIAMIQGFARPEATPAGKVDHIIDFQFTPDGKVLANGQEIPMGDEAPMEDSPEVEVTPAPEAPR